LKKDINSKNFIIRQNTESKLIINANTFCNSLKLKIDNIEYMPINNLIHIELENIKEKYSLNIINSLYSEQFINFYKYEASLNSDSKIFIKEGILYNNKLTKNNNELNYSLYLNTNGNYYLYFRKYSNSNIKITIDENPLSINKLSELIKISNKVCSSEVCEYLIKIEKENKENNETELDFTFQIINYDEKI